MTTLRDRQRRHSELMRVLAALEFQNPESQRSNASHRTGQTKEDMKHLETIALYMASGERGDVVASAFDKTASPNRITIFLARNNGASDQDLKDARLFLNYLKDPENKAFLDFLPFLVRRSSQNLQRRINKVRDLTIQLRETLDEGITTYTGSRSSARKLIFNAKVEFPRYNQYLEKLGANSTQTGKQSRDLINDLKTIPDICETTLEISSSQDDADFHRKLDNFMLAASVLGKSKFFSTFTANTSKTGFTSLSKLWRNLDKLRQFRRITDLGKFVRQDLLEFTICWVPANVSTTPHELDNIRVRSVPEVITKFGQEHLGIRKTKTQVDELIQKENQYWKKQEKLRRPQGVTISPKVHAEIQIIHALGSLTSPSNPTNFKPQRAIGCSKRSCLQCWLYMKKVNDFLSEEWMTAGDHSWPYDTAALTGAHVTLDPNGECDTYIEDRVSQYALKKVRQLYGLDHQRPSLHFRKISEEYASSSSGESDSDTGNSDRQS